MASITRPAAGAPARNRWGIISWVFMRVSALALIFLALGHFAIQHVINDVHDLTIDVVAARWTSLGYRVYTALLLALALVHGFNGLRIVADDYVPNPRWNKVVRIAIVVVAGALIVIGSIALIGGVSQP